MSPVTQIDAKGAQVDCIVVLRNSTRKKNTQIHLFSFITVFALRHSDQHSRLKMFACSELLLKNRNTLLHSLHRMLVMLISYIVSTNV